MNAERHQVVHQIVAWRDAVEHLTHQAALCRARNAAESEIGGVARAGLSLMRPIYSVPHPNAGTPRSRDGDARPSATAGGSRDRARHRQSPGPALAAAGGPAAAADRRSRRRLPPPRQVHADATGRRRFGAAASRHVRPDGAGSGAPEPAHAARAPGAGDRRRLARGLRRSAPIRFGRSGADTAEDTHELLAGLGPEPLDARSPLPACRRRSPASDADQGRAARPEGRRRPWQHLRMRGAVPGTAQPAALGPHRRPAPARRVWCRRSRTRYGGDRRRWFILRDYVQPHGELGYFQHAWKVYGREGEPCERCPGAARLLSACAAWSSRPAAHSIARVPSAS